MLPALKRWSVLTGEDTVMLSRDPGAVTELEDRHRQVSALLELADGTRTPEQIAEVMTCRWPALSAEEVLDALHDLVYRHAISEEIQVHVLEHGHVLLQYAPGISVEQVRLLEEIARRHFRELVAAPYDRLGEGIALTAWGRIERLGRVDEGRIEHFIQAFAGRYVHGRRTYR